MTVEQEKYFSAIVAATPMGNHSYTDSLDSVLMLTPAEKSAALQAEVTPSGTRRKPQLTLFAPSVRSSREKAMCM